MQNASLASLFAVASALVSLGLVQPATAQDAQSCTDEVNRVTEAFPLSRTEAERGLGIAQQPGSRVGANLEDDQRQEIHELLEQARSAGMQGDGRLCMEKLVEARTMLRHAGVGSTRPGSVAPSGLSPSTSGLPETSAPPPGGRGDTSSPIDGVPTRPGDSGSAAERPGSGDSGRGGSGTGVGGAARSGGTGGTPGGGSSGGGGGGSSGGGGR